jgi:hypothetical protein
MWALVIVALSSLYLPWNDVAQTGQAVLACKRTAGALESVGKIVGKPGQAYGSRGA